MNGLGLGFSAAEWTIVKAEHQVGQLARAAAGIQTAAGTQQLHRMASGILGADAGAVQLQKMASGILGAGAGAVQLQHAMSIGTTPDAIARMSGSVCQLGVAADFTRALLVLMPTLERVANIATAHFRRACEEALNADHVGKMKEFTLEVVGLNANYWPEVAEVLFKGHWRDASNPVGFIRSMAKRSREQRLGRDNRPMINPPKKKMHWGEEIGRSIMGEPRDRHTLFELVHDAPLDSEEERQVLIYNTAFQVPRRQLPNLLDWDPADVERIRRRVARKLKKGR